jgi:hypothetical protein
MTRRLKMGEAKKRGGKREQKSLADFFREAVAALDDPEVREVLQFAEQRAADDPKMAETCSGRSATEHLDARDRRRVSELPSAAQTERRLKMPIEFLPRALARARTES